MVPVLRLTNAVVNGVAQATTAEDGTVSFSFYVNDSDNLDSINLSTTGVDNNIIQSVAFTRDGTNATATIALKANATTAEELFNIRATDGTGFFTEVPFRLIVTPVNDAPTLSLSASSATL